MEMLITVVPKCTKFETRALEKQLYGTRHDQR